jgi:hypothetical protein
MGRENVNVQIEGDGGSHNLSVWADDQDEFVVVQVDAGPPVSVRPRDLLDAVLFVQSLPIG